MNNKLRQAFMSLIATVMLFSVLTFGGTFVKDDVTAPYVITAQAASKKTALNKTKVNLTTGATYTVKLIDKKGKTVSPSKVKWSTSSKKIATVSKSGVIKGVAKGTAKITAAYKGKKYTCNVTVKNAVLSETKKTIYTGSSVTLTLKDGFGKTIPAKNVKWTTSKKSVATVSSKGVVKAVKKGSATITASYKGKKYTFKATVKTAYVKFEKSSQTLYLGGVYTLEPTYYPENATVKYTTDNNKIVKITGYSGYMKIQALKAGKATVTASLYLKEKKIATKKITVTVKKPYVRFNDDSVVCFYAEKKKLDLETGPANANLKFSLSDESKLFTNSADREIQVKPYAQSGKVKLKAYFTYGGKTYSDTCTVTVKHPYIELDKSNLLVENGKKATLTADISAPSGTKVKWSSKDTTVATVSSKGVVTGKKDGVTTVTAAITVGSKTVESKCEVTVCSEGYSFKDPLSGQSGKEITLQRSIRSAKKIKINVTEVITGERADYIALQGSSYNTIEDGYEWRFVVFDLEYISSEGGYGDILKAVDVVNPLGSDLFDGTGRKVPVMKSAALIKSFGNVVETESWANIELYPGASSRVHIGVQIPEGTGDLILRIPNGKVHTFVRLSSDNENTEFSVKENINILKNYIIDKGFENDNGNLYIQESYFDYPNREHYGIVYDTEKRTLSFTIHAITEYIEHVISFELDEDSDVLAVEAIIKYSPSYNQAYYGGATAYLNKKGFSENTQLKFNWDSFADADIASSSDEMLNLSFRLGVREWNNLMNERVGLTLYDLGFEH